jgi:AraC-like DNA-binding protein
MYWIKDMQNAIAFIEGILMNEINIDDVARCANSSTANFYRIFAIVTGVSAGDYIRSRRLSLAGREIAETDAKALDVAVKYGYDTAASFTKAFTRFHGVTPSDVRRRKSAIKYYAPLVINIDIRGGLNMRRRLIPNVPVIKYDGNNAAFFNYLLRITLDCVGESVDKSKLVALSGEGNRFCWMDGVWNWGNEVTEAINETPFETQHRVLSAIGWNAKYITVQKDKGGNYMNTDRLQIRQDFVDSIDNGFPVITRIAMDDNDHNVFFGYADDGERIIGYRYNANHMKDNAQPVDLSVPFEFEDWERDVKGYIILQSKSEAASERNAALATFRTAVKHARRTSPVRGSLVGHAAWESFLRLLEHDDFTNIPLLQKDVTKDYPKHTQSVQHRLYIYCDGLCQIWARNDALAYYRSLIEKFPEWKEELETAAAALKACANYAAFWFQSEGLRQDDAGYEKFRTADCRKRLADAGREALKNDITAIEQFETILKKEGAADV